MYPAADKPPVPGLSQDHAVLRAELDRAAVAEDWRRVIEIATALVALTSGEE